MVRDLKVDTCESLPRVISGVPAERLVIIGQGRSNDLQSEIPPGDAFSI
jgi:hypothetical protein